MMRAINDYPITDEIRALIVEKNVTALRESLSPREISRSSKILIAADMMNLKREHGPRRPDQHVHIHGEKPSNLLDLKARLTERRLAREQAERDAAELAAQGPEGGESGPEPVANSDTGAGGDVAFPAHPGPVVFETTAVNVTP